MQVHTPGLQIVEHGVSARRRIAADISHRTQAGLACGPGQGMQVIRPGPAETGQPVICLPKGSIDPRTQLEPLVPGDNRVQGIQSQHVPGLPRRNQFRIFNWLDHTILYKRNVMHMCPAPGIVPG